MPETFPVATEQMLNRICAEFLEMPGLRLTRGQAQRLWGLDEQTCARVLEMLLQVGFLQRSRNETYARLTDGPPGASLPDIVHDALAGAGRKASSDRRQFPRAGP
jgi:hypothetical protein